MTQEISTHGDLLEVTCANLIMSKLPSYEQIWKLYIGHDGQGRMLESDGLSEKQEKTRETFAQYHYTGLECVVSMQLIAEKAKEYSFEKFEHILMQNNDFIAFNAYVGKIRDCVKRMGELLGADGLHLKFESYWKDRCVVIHKKKLPFSIIGDVYSILKDPGTMSNVPPSEEISWYSYQEEDFCFITDYFENTFDGVVCELNSALFQLLGKITDLQKKTQFQLKQTDFGGLGYDCTEDIRNLSNLSPSVNLKFATSASTSIYGDKE